MSIRENVSRVLFFSLLLTTLLAPVVSKATITQFANNNDTKFTLFQPEDKEKMPTAVIACNDASTNGSCGG